MMTGMVSGIVLMVINKPTFNHTAMKISETMCFSIGLFVHFKIQDLMYSFKKRKINNQNCMSYTDYTLTANNSIRVY